MEIRSLQDLDWATLARAFNDAFSDYVVPVTIDGAGLERMQRRRGYVGEASLGAFVGDRLAGFALTCIDGDRAYNSGTGVVPEHRRGGLARRLIDEVALRLEARRYVLEVIDSNAPARQLYERTGFVETRGLQSWTFGASGEAQSPPALTAPDLPAIARAADVEASWQNSVASIRRALDPWVALGDERGVVVVFPESGDVPLLWEHPEDRRRGRGRRLLEAAAGRASRPLRLVNVDERSAEAARFLEAVGAARTVRQVEMIRELR